MRFKRLVGILAPLLTLIGPAAAQQGYPNKQIRIIVPFTPGGSNDILARILGQKLTEGWGRPVVVENRPGGSTIIGSEALAKAPPDGHTLMVTSVTHVITPLLVSTPYDPIRDFAPVGTLSSNEMILLLHPSLPVNSVRELIQLAKLKPGQLNYASTGVGGAAHLAGEFFNLLTGINIQHVPYKGGTPAITDLLGGQVHMTWVGPSSAVGYIHGKKLKGLAVSGSKRLAALPQVPTFGESGLRDFDMKGWFGVLSPAGTPREIIDKLSAEIAKVLSLADIREKLVKQALEPFVTTPSEFAVLMKADQIKYTRIIRTANIKAPE